MKAVRAMKLELFNQNNIITNLPTAVMRELATHSDVEILDQAEYPTLGRPDMKTRINEMYCDVLTLVLQVARKAIPKYESLDVEGTMRELMDEFEEKDLVFVDNFMVITARKQRRV